MDDSHRYILQYVLGKASTPLEDVLNYCSKLPDPIQDSNKLNNAIKVINKEIIEQSFKIVCTTCEVTQKKLVLFVNLSKNDDISKMQTSFTPDQLKYFDLIKEEILDSNNFKISYITALNLTASIITKANGEQVLNKWFETGYFLKNKDFIYLGALLIQETYSELITRFANRKCKLCGELIFTGKTCAACETLVHTHCLKDFRSTVKQKKCPECGNIFIARTEAVDDEQ